LRYTTYCTAIKYGGALEWDFAFQMVPKVTSSQHRDTLLSALGCSREPWILVRYLSKSMDPDSAIRKQDGRRVVGAVAANPVGRPIAFNFLKKNFDELLP
jgi:aminopeptidase N